MNFFMKKHYTVFLVLGLFFSISVVAQQPVLNTSLIKQELTEKAHAVIRANSTNVTLEAIDKMVIKKRMVVTVLDKFGRTAAAIAQGYNNDVKIIKLSAKIYNAAGKEIKKYTKGKFLDVSAVDGGTLYSDARMKYVNYTPTEYPYTVVFETTYKTSSTGFIPVWFPFEHEATSVEKSEYHIHNPNHFKLRTKEKNCQGFAIENTASLPHMVSYSMQNQPAISYESNTLSHIDLMPHVLFSLDEFTLRQVPGKATNWKEFGNWMNEKLLKNKRTLSPVTIQKVKRLVEGVHDTIEKAKIIYNYVQNKTRYIGVQVGIGGWEPIAANEVDKVGYGDCKGLTNYTKALLDAVGVPSYYTIVYANERRDIDKNFTSIQGNHAFLHIPNGKQDVWLECTSQTMPFGFLGSFTDNRDVLVITPEGGIIKRTPAYRDETNVQTTKATIDLDEKGNVKAIINIESKGIQYYDTFAIGSKSTDDLKKHYKSDVWSYNNDLEVQSVVLNDDKDRIVFTENVEVTIADYASVTPSEYLFRVNVFNKNTYVPKRYRTRKLPLKIRRGYKDVDEFTIHIPNGYVLRQLPLPKDITSKFGTYKTTCTKVNDTTLVYKKSILIKAGVHPKEDYKLYRKFRKSIAKYENLRIALHKK